MAISTKEWSKQTKQRILLSALVILAAAFILFLVV